jgi:hypothetical protein
MVAVITGAVLAAACGARDGRDRPALAGAIEVTLAGRFAQRVRARCLGLVDVCVAELSDGPALPIGTTRDPQGGWVWSVDGLVIDTAPLMAYLTAEVGALGAPQSVVCGPRFRRAAAGDRLACTLGGGGVAFATVLADGRTSIEIELDPAVARLRAASLDDERAVDAALAAASRALDGASTDESEGEPGPADRPADGFDQASAASDPR